MKRQSECTRCGRSSKNMPGKCKEPKYLSTNLAKTVEEILGGAIIW